MPSWTTPGRLSVAAPVMLAVLAGAGQALAQGAAEDRRPIVLQRQGSFAFGGSVAPDATTDSTLHCDHGYTEFQTPVNARRFPIVMWHSTSTKTWTSTPGGQIGFQDIFLRRGFEVHIIDLPRQGRAGLSCVETVWTPQVGRDQRTFIGWRLGTWELPGDPQFHANSQTPKDTAFLNQVLRARYPDNEDFEDTDDVESSAVAGLLDKIGPAVLMTHSGSGRYGWLTAFKSSRVKAIVSFEPGVSVFPTGELPPPIEGNTPLEVSPADFGKLTRFPILIVYGDYLDQAQNWQASFTNATAFVEAINRHGGDAEIVHLPDLGLTGNTHIMMLERNNREVANVVSRFLHRRGLDTRPD